MEDVLPYRRHLTLQQNNETDESNQFFIIGSSQIIQNTIGKLLNLFQKFPPGKIAVFHLKILSVVCELKRGEFIYECQPQLLAQK